jgi:hypothetical protein
MTLQKLVPRAQKGKAMWIFPVYGMVLCGAEKGRVGRRK